MLTASSECQRGPGGSDAEPGDQQCVIPATDSLPGPQVSFQHLAAHWGESGGNGIDSYLTNFFFFQR